MHWAEEFPLTGEIRINVKMQSVVVESVKMGAVQKKVMLMWLCGEAGM